MLRAVLLAGVLSLSTVQVPKPLPLRTFQEFMAEHDRLLHRSAEVFDREMARDKSGDCPGAVTTIEWNDCLSREVETTMANYREYVATLRALTGLHVAGDAPSTGPTGTAPTPDDMVIELDQLEASWRAYEKRLCTAAFHQYQSGTIAPGKQMSCELTTTRMHIRELGRILGDVFLH